MHERVKKYYDPFLWIEFNYLKGVEPLRRDSLLLTLKSSGFSDTQFNQPRKDDRLSRP